MSEHAENFIEHLNGLKDKNRGALAALRHSLTFEPGAYPKAFPYVERFVGADRHAQDSRRLALYAIAGLFACHPLQRTQSFATAFGELMHSRSQPQEPNKSTENRFIALLGADAENILDYLRQAISLLATAEIGFDYVRLLDDVSIWMNPVADRDRLRQRWARDFYRAAYAESELDTSNN